MVIKITLKQSKRINTLVRKLCCNYVDGSCLLLDDGEEHACVQWSAGTESTATISKTQSFPQTGNCLPRSCSQAVKRDAKSASRTSYQGQKTSATAQTVPPSKSGRKPPSASAGNGQCSLKQVSGCGSPVETSAQSAEAPTEAVAETAALTSDTVLRR